MMPLSRITKRTEEILIIKGKATGLSNPKLIELALIHLPRINLKIEIKTKK